jgi:hypothetical protein
MEPWVTMSSTYRSHKERKKVRDVASYLGLRIVSSFFALRWTGFAPSELRAFYYDTQDSTNPTPRAHCPVCASRLNHFWLDSPSRVRPAEQLAESRKTYQSPLPLWPAFGLVLKQEQCPRSRWCSA